MRRLKLGSILFTLLLSAYALVVALISFGYSSQARLAPVAVGFAAFLAGVLVLIREYRPELMSNLDVSPVDFAFKGTGKRANSKKPVELERRRGELTMCFWSLIFLILIGLVGFGISVGVYVLFFLKIHAKVHWLKAFLISLTTLGFIYVMFELLLKVELFRGLFFGAILPPL